MHLRTVADRGLWALDAVSVLKMKHRICAAVEYLLDRAIRQSCGISPLPPPTPVSPSTSEMFVTRSHLQLPSVPGRVAADAQYWRSIGLATSQAWFLATFERYNGSTADRETVCISWERDLLLHIEAPGVVQLIDLLCLVPPWCSDLPNWTSRAIASVWVGSYRDAEVPLFIDVDGNEFCSHLLDVPPEKIRQRRLVSEVVGRRAHA